MVRRFPVLKAAALKLSGISPALQSRLVRFGRERPQIGSYTRPLLLRSADRRRAARLRLPVKPAAPCPPRTIYVYVDHTVTCTVNTGVQRVVRGIGRGLLAAGAPVRFVRWSRELKALVLIDRADLGHLSQWSGPEIGDQLDLYPDDNSAESLVEKHSDIEESWLLVPEVPHINHVGDQPTLDIILVARQLGLRTAFVFYDAIPVKRAEYAGMAAPHEAYMRQLLMADLVLPISRWSESDLVKYFAHHECAGPASIPVTQPIHLPSRTIDAAGGAVAAGREENVILCVGTIEPRKNQIAAIKAFEKFSARHADAGWQLVLIGNLDPALREEITGAVARNPRIKHLGAVSDEDLLAYYSKAAFSVFASLEEGYGLPIIESLNHGKPCICANFGAMGEVAEGGGCLMIDTRDVGALAAAMERLATDSGERARLAAEARARKQTDWNDYAREVMSALDAMRAGRRVDRVYYWVDQTCEYPANTGIQRVVRSLAKALIDSGTPVIPVKWDLAGKRFVAASPSDLEHLAKWNGPAPATWMPFDAFAGSGAGDWLLNAEVVSAPSGPRIEDIHRQARDHDLRIGWIFYDAIPHKLAELYPPQASEAHGAYMAALQDAHLVLPISDHARRDLVEFVARRPQRSPSFGDTTRTCSLPAEFPGVRRTLETAPAREGPAQILCVGTVEPRKNHLIMLEAFEALLAEPAVPPVELTIVGGQPYPDLARQVEERIARMGHVTWLKSCSDEQLQALYEKCHFTVYPSIEEGFGLPILESLWHGRPCICRSSGSMAELAAGGGCLAVETNSVGELAEAMRRLVCDDGLRASLAGEAFKRPFRTWADYAGEVLGRMGRQGPQPQRRAKALPSSAHSFTAEFRNLAPRPLLSVCITTYNRAQWLALSLENIMRELPTPDPEIEIVVCDNTSTDNTQETVTPYLARSDLKYYRNPKNVGMLGNLRVTAHHARGRYIWILGDDDLLQPGAIRKVTTALRQARDASLVYLNYAYTREEDPRRLGDFDAFLASATPITEPTPDKTARIAELSTMSENFFTAIYCLVLRRDHALMAYSQDTTGRPFSSLLTCIPTTRHVLDRMMEETGIWLGQPQVVVNMNVSWLKYAPLWVLERLPEAFALAERMGADPGRMDDYRRRQLPGVWHYFNEMIKDDPEGNRNYFDFDRFACRFKHLPEFARRQRELDDAWNALLAGLDESSNDARRT